ncbi:hypothetical protein BO70DRAFT_389104 [Aspergillus heteromorphus CBS 117.55]|uniref:Extracellular mutant protein 11 C-terminal domain-containing protein n=1 Tax=Aspergillus heteromorphus CBS 117.55 TaxID=1448321 RepID=A0A317VNU5_9EURO|nr:uncharacterized protein BO70DRAFT_389104 [Aspergillus heteromorphus CBS 117.55]PWY73600.1 hypothetical protein BO70DRAFT_389104 [Aspergillus heteromorphus CBS 117.55]
MASFPAASLFSLPLTSWQQPRSVRVSRYEPRKRKKDLNDWGDDDDDGEGDGDTTDAVSEVAPGTSLTLSPDEAHQYRVAGLSFDRELPGGRFPHGPAQDQPTRPHTKERILKELTSLSSPIFLPQAAAHQGNLRMQHLAVLSSILHRCLLQGDYIRAGRAWGLILREEVRGAPIDVRAEGRWGIGAEILLRRETTAENALVDDGSPVVAAPSSGPFFTREGFENAKEYYELLIIQHPYRKFHHDAINPLHFYPAMFGLWIYVAQEESKASRQDIRNEHGSTLEDYSDDEESESELLERASSRQRVYALLAGARKKELDEAQKIAARMDEIIVSPPYADSSELLELRGMVSLWIADLHVSSVPFTRRNKRMDDSDTDGNGSVSADDIQENLQERRERRFAFERKEAESQKSQEFFQKAKQRGKGVASTLGDFHIDDDDDDDDDFVGDYVHAKGAGQPRPRTTEAANQSRQALAAQARVEVPSTTLVAPVPLPFNKPVSLEHYGAPSFTEQMPQAPADNHAHRDMFDTDVEGIDDSTIAATSVIGVEDVPLQYQLRPATVPQQQQQHHHHHHHHQEADVDDERPLYPSRLPRRAYDGKWYENLGDKAMRSAGFDSEDVDNTSQLTSMAGDDEQSDTTEDPDYVRGYRSSAEEPLSKRLHNFWSASRKSYQNPETTAYPEPSKGASHRQSTITDARMANPVTGNRKVTLPRSMTATPRTRFSPPKPSLLEQLDITPTRRTSGPRPQPGKEPGITTTTATTTINHRDSEDDAHLFHPSHSHRRHDSLPPLSAFDMTNLDDLDSDPINDPFSRRASFFSTLSIDEWEDYGDLLIDQFSAALSEMKDLRQARRKTAATFEAEVKRRHEVVEDQSADLSRKFDEMRSGGAEVLRGRTP